jgi:carbamoyl-phosphate synthase large subunit
VRPSYVLGGRAMEIVRDEEEPAPLHAGECAVERRRPINSWAGAHRRYLDDAIEVDVDACATARTSSSAASWSTSRRPASTPATAPARCRPLALGEDMLDELERQTKALALALKVGGLMNVQYAIKDGDIYVLEVNPRASRTVPFVAKTIGAPIAKIASRIMAGESLASFGLSEKSLDHIAVKEAVFPFPASPASTRCSARKCAPPARSWATWGAPRTARRSRT